MTEGFDIEELISNSMARLLVKAKSYQDKNN